MPDERAQRAHGGAASASECDADGVRGRSPRAMSERAWAAAARGLAQPVQIGSVHLRNGVMTASGTAGYGTELAGLLDHAALGAFVTKSLAAFEWAGNPAPRLHPTTAGMLNAVGLQGPGLAVWQRDVLPVLLGTGATVVVSIWGRTLDEYRRAATLVGACPAGVVAVEVNLSCPNLDGGAHLFAHDAERSAAVVAAVSAAAGRPCWAKLSPNTDRLAAVAASVAEAGAEAVTCVNTLLGLAYDQRTAAPALGAGGGGLSGPAIHPVAVPRRPRRRRRRARPADHRRRGRAHRLGRRRDGPRRCVGRPGGHGDLRRPPGGGHPARCAAPGVIPGAGRDLR